MLCCSCIWNHGNASYVNIHLSAVPGPTGDQIFLKIITHENIKKEKKPLDGWLIVSSGESALLCNLLRPHRVSYQMTFVKVTIMSVFYFYLIPPCPSHLSACLEKCALWKTEQDAQPFVTRRLWVTIGFAEQKMRLSAFWQTDWEKHVSCQPRATPPRHHHPYPSAKQWQEKRICFNSGYKRLSEIIENNTDSCKWGITTWKVEGPQTKILRGSHEWRDAAVCAHLSVVS